MEGSRGIVLDHAATGSSFRGVSGLPFPSRHAGLVRSESDAQVKKIVTLWSACCGWQSGENALKQHGGGHFPGIPPLRAIDFLKGKQLPWRSGRDDTRAGLKNSSRLLGSGYPYRLDNLNERFNPAGLDSVEKSKL